MIQKFKINNYCKKNMQNEVKLSWGKPENQKENLQSRERPSDKLYSHDAKPRNWTWDPSGERRVHYHYATLDPVYIMHSCTCHCWVFLVFLQSPWFYHQRQPLNCIECHGMAPCRNKMQTCITKLCTLKITVEFICESKWLF